MAIPNSKLSVMTRGYIPRYHQESQGNPTEGTSLKGTFLSETTSNSPRITMLSMLSLDAVHARGIQKFPKNKHKKQLNGEPDTELRIEFTNHLIV